MSLRRLTPRQLLLALAISAALLDGAALTLFVLDQREKAAVTAEDLFAAIGQGDMTPVEVAREKGSHSAAKGEWLLRCAHFQ